MENEKIQTILNKNERTPQEIMEVANYYIDRENLTVKLIAKKLGMGKTKLAEIFKTNNIKKNSLTKLYSFQNPTEYIEKPTILLKKTTKQKTQNLVEKEKISWEKNLIIICDRLDEISKLIKSQSGDLRKDETVSKTDESFKSVFIF